MRLKCSKNIHIILMRSLLTKIQLTIFKLCRIIIRYRNNHNKKILTTFTKTILVKVSLITRILNSKPLHSHVGDLNLQRRFM